MSADHVLTGTIAKDHDGVFAEVAVGVPAVGLAPQKLRAPGTLTYWTTMVPVIPSPGWNLQKYS